MLGSFIICPTNQGLHKAEPENILRLIGNWNRASWGGRKYFAVNPELKTYSLLIGLLTSLSHNQLLEVQQGG